MVMVKDQSQIEIVNNPFLFRYSFPSTSLSYFASNIFLYFLTEMAISFSVSQNCCLLSEAVVSWIFYTVSFYGLRLHLYTFYSGYPIYLYWCGKKKMYACIIMFIKRNNYSLLTNHGQNNADIFTTEGSCGLWNIKGLPMINTAWCLI